MNNNWKQYYENNPKRYCWDLMWNTTRATGNIARPHPKIYVGDYLSEVPSDVIAVVNVAAEMENRPGLERIDQYKVGLPDPGKHTCKFDIFVKAVVLVRRLVESYRYAVLVHCASGMSRSIAVTATATALLNQSTVIDEIKRIAKTRPEIYPESCYVIFGEILNREFSE